MTRIPPFTPLEVDRDKLTISGVPFPDIKTLNAVSSGIGTNMFEGFKPTKRDIEIAKEHFTNNLSVDELLKLIKEKHNVQ